MPRKKLTPPVETPENEAMNPSQEAPETPPAPPAPPQVTEEAPVPAAPEEAAETAPETPFVPPAPPQTLEEGPASVAPDEADEAAPECRRSVVRSPKGLNLRVGPALSYDVLEVLPDGMEVLTLALPRGVTVPGWELVVAVERAGWASARFLRPLEG